MNARYDQLSPVPPLTSATKAIIITCVVTFFVDFFLTSLGVRPGGLELTEILGLVPARIVNDLWLWQFVTYIFMHGSPLHLLLNMLILWFFGSEIENRMGKKNFLIYFFVCGIGGGIFNFLVNASFLDVSRLQNPIIGASGAIFGILAAYGIFFGERFMLVFFIFPMKAKYFVLIMAAIELITGVQARAQDNVAHFAHLGGMGIGALYIYFRYIRPRGGKGGQNKKELERERLKKQFTLIVNESAGKNDDTDGPRWN
jgi:membrane associated rhomboid family serine protease